MRRNAAWLALVIAAAGAGYLLGSGSERQPGTRADPPTKRDVGTLEATPQPRAPEATAPEPGPDPTPKGRETVREALIRELGEVPDESRIEDAARRAAKMREDCLTAAELAEQAAARQLANEIRKERALLEDKARGGAMELLRGLAKESRTPVLGLAGDEKAFDALFTRKVSGPVIDGESWNGGPLADGSTLLFPAGAFMVAFPRDKEFPRDLVIQGAGMDGTLLRLKDQLRSRGEVMSLAFRDLTIDCNQNYLTDLRLEPASIRMESCRVVGFGGAMIVAQSLAFRARDCRFEARFQIGANYLFQIQAGVARFDNCVILGPFGAIFDQHQGTFVFHRCDVIDAQAIDERIFMQSPDRVRFEECRFTYLAPDAGFIGQARPLSDLNSAWPAK